MSEHAGTSHVDTQVLTDAGTYVYESIATLEYSGRKTTRAEIAAAVTLDDATLDEVLAKLMTIGALTSSGSGDDCSYAPANRGWSTKPDTATGHQLS
jgi:hypothetical protein